MITKSVKLYIVAMLALFEDSIKILLCKIGCLPMASFRFHLAKNTLAVGYVIPAIRAYSGLAPVRQCSCRAYKRDGSSKQKLPSLV